MLHINLPLADRWTLPTGTDGGSAILVPEGRFWSRVPVADQFTFKIWKLC